ncbi:tRNA (cytosine-5-)-methyltransferase ncl1 [Dimargaris xerosporica]|nr:tRNA (cytosine-5-)-methyltransferase ncl1 [Dimargaris xerosporica]
MARHKRKWPKKGRRANNPEAQAGSETAGEKFDYQPITDFQKCNDQFNAFYQAQNLLATQEEWDEMVETMRVVLPTSFRITGHRQHALELRDLLERKFVPFIRSLAMEGETLDPPTPIPWYPQNLGWQFKLPRIALKKSDTLRQFHSFLVTETDIGNISRQEVVSMIPPLLLDVQPGQRVLDMCAAPGSKTAQLLEALHADNGQDEFTKGLVIANDADLKRACMLVHQTKRLHSPCLLVTNQDAEQFSHTLYPPSGDSKHPTPILFDRILCDVPCSGDGTMRKNLLIWRDWSIKDSLGLHRTQVRIAQRAALLLKVGGRMVYSTCSLNPMENEAVVAELLNTTQGALRLLDMSQALPGLKRRPGITTWKVMARDGTLVDDYKQFATKVPQRSLAKYPPSLFPPVNITSLGMDRCLRIYAHLQNTGGFFVAVFEKVQPLTQRDLPSDEPEPNAGTPVETAASDSASDTASPLPAKRARVEPTTGAAGAGAMEEPANHASKPNDEALPPLESKASPATAMVEVAEARDPSDRAPIKDQPYTFLEPTDPDLDRIWEFYEISPEVPRDLFMTRSEGTRQRAMYMVSTDIKVLMSVARNERMRVVNTGIKCFSRNDIDNTPCNYRIHSEALPLLFPYLGEARKVQLPLSDAKLLLETPGHVNFTMLSQGLQDQVQPIDLGCCIGILDAAKDEANKGAGDQSGGDPGLTTVTSPMTLPLWRGKGSVNILLSKQDKSSVYMRLFGVPIKPAAKPACDKCSEKQDQANGNSSK